MTRKLPPEEAFTLYVSQGARRSYSSVADHFGVSKVAVTNCAKKNEWQARLIAAEQRAFAESESEAVQMLGEMRIRHIAAARRLLDSAISALEGMEIKTPEQVVKVVDAAVRIERLSREEAVSKVALEIERIEDGRPPFLEAHHGRARRPAYE